MAVDAFAWPSPRAAYVHVPFCRHRCGYCNFSVIADRDDLIDKYLVAIDRELSTLDCPEVDSVFIGGGTPTHLQTDSLDRFLEIVGSRFQLASAYEWTVEANPEDISSEKLSLLVEHGVNRISLGVQSFNDQKLQRLERGHDGDTAQRIVEQVAKEIPNVSIDLIFAAPDETVVAWSRDLDTAMGLPIKHLSTYTLTYEKGTSFWNRQRKGELSKLDDDLEVEMYSLARSRTSVSGLQQYEISSFARDGFRCRHNLAYWRGAGWYGAGPGAARFVGGQRQTNHRSTTTYLKRIDAGESPIAETETITREVHARERMAFGVRMIDGIDLDSIHSSTGIDISVLCGEAIEMCKDDGLIKDQDNVISMTESGILFADTVAARFLD